MGNTCACFNDDNKDKEEFKSIRVYLRPSAVAFFAACRAVCIRENLR